MIKVTNLTKTFGNQVIFDSISFTINPGERVGLTGRNGHGKTTLFKIIINEEHADSGEISVPRNYLVGHVTQHLNFTRATVLEEGCLGLRDYEKDDHWKVEKILFGLGFTKEDMKRSPAEFSGGYQVRLNLGKVLVSEPNLLLLDEPTNYLDIVSIRWLSSFLRQWSNELILITHDRAFMNGVSTHTMGIHRKKIRKIEGGTDKLFNQILKEEEIYEKTRINDEKKNKEAEIFITRFRAKARLAGMVQSRIKALQKQEKMDRLEKIKDLDFFFDYKPFQAKVLAAARDVTFSYDKTGDPLISDFSLTIGRQDRICVIGRNGKGKTTLLRILAGVLPPDSGAVTVHPSAVSGYFAQTNTAVLNPAMTVEEEIMASGCERQAARNICGAMMFEGDMALKKIGVISGGEKSRVLLGKILATPTNLILLDEPTNHLDMESSDALLAAIDSFEGAVVIVTHNEMFLHTLANRFIIFQGRSISVFEGSYQSFLDRVGWDEEVQAAERSGNDEKPGAGANKKDLRKMRAEILTRRSRDLRPLEERIARIEEGITSLEEQLAGLSDEIARASQEGRGARISELSQEVHRVQGDINTLYEEFEQKTNEYDGMVKFFDAELRSLEERP